MKYVLITLIFLSATLKSLGQNDKVNPVKVINGITYNVYGEDTTNPKPLSDASQKFKQLKVKDTLDFTLKTTIKEVCSVKGCWLNFDLDNGEQVKVKFKDYSFFVPLDSAGKEAILTGKAFIKKESIADLKHYAKDAGASPSDIEKIKGMEDRFVFVANAVLIAD